MSNTVSEERFAVTRCTREDFYEILETQAEFWDGRDMRHLFHPFLFHQFGDSAFVIRDGGQVVAYLFGLLSQTEPVAHAHAIAVRPSARRHKLGQRLYAAFTDFARAHGCTHIKAITSPDNRRSIAFHRSIGMTLQGEPNADGIPVVRGYARRDVDHVVFQKAL
jgi:ribosomal protein S18 acetylase RimI-like enzyme